MKNNDQEQVGDYDALNTTDKNSEETQTTVQSDELSERVSTSAHSSRLQEYINKRK